MKMETLSDQNKPDGKGDSTSINRRVKFLETDSLVVTRKWRSEGGVVSV
jgi:hypothetical protein